MRIAASICSACLTLLLCVAAFAQSDPLSIRHEKKGASIEVTITAYANLHALKIVVHDAQTGKDRRFQRASLNDGAEWIVRMPEPKVPSDWRVDIQALYGEQELKGYYSFPVGPLPTLDFQMVESQFDGTRNEIVLVPNAAVREVRVLARNESGDTMLDMVRPVEGDAGDRVVVPFHTASRVLNVDVLLTAESGATREYRFTPWSLQTEARGLNFATGSATIASSDLAVLDAVAEELRAAVERVGQYVDLQLYIAGYTDTVGRASANEALSRDRAHAIARHMRQRGITVPIMIQGFGESALAVATADNVDEPANRRAIFVLRSNPPPVNGHFPANQWRRIQ